VDLDHVELIASRVLRRRRVRRRSSAGLERLVRRAVWYTDPAGTAGRPAGPRLRGPCPDSAGRLQLRRQI